MSFDGDNSGEKSSVSRRKLEDIPESCIAMVLGYLDPPEICRLARINRAFRDASSADFIWVNKLPTNYSFIIHKLSDKYKDDYEDINSHSSDDKMVGLTKKNVFARLSRPNLFDSGTKVILILSFSMFLLFFFKFFYMFSVIFPNYDIKNKILCETVSLFNFFFNSLIFHNY